MQKNKAINNPLHGKSGKSIQALHAMGSLENNAMYSAAIVLPSNVVRPISEPFKFSESKINDFANGGRVAQ